MMITDKTGREIMAGDTLKVYHFTAALRREKCYMYKYVKERIDGDGGGIRFLIVHLNGDLNTWYYQLIDGRQFDTIEIVQGYAGVESGRDFKDRPKHKEAK